jgi:hypothetical protein
VVSVVLPDPGPPAIRLNENAGTPPPSTSFSPGTPVSRSLSEGRSGFACLRGCFLASAGITPSS